jgi:hypothetical protein
LIVYLDTSVVLAQLFSEDRSPPDAFWAQRFVASRLLEYEVLNRVHACHGFETHGSDACRLLERVNLVEMSTEVLERALSPFPKPVRPLDALHLATLVFLRGRGLEVRLATYDGRLMSAAVALGFELASC